MRTLSIKQNRSGVMDNLHISGAKNDTQTFLSIYNIGFGGGNVNLDPIEFRRLCQWCENRLYELFDLEQTGEEVRNGNNL